MTDEPMSVVKYEYVEPLGEGLLADPSPVAEMMRSVTDRSERIMDRWMKSTPQERVEWARAGTRWDAERARERAEVRAATAPTPLTIEALLAKMGWDREYAEHLVQPYCDCHEESYDGGWSYCDHARDLGLAG